MLLMINSADIHFRDPYDRNEFNFVCKSKFLIFIYNTFFIHIIVDYQIVFLLLCFVKRMNIIRDKAIPADDLL